METKTDQKENKYQQRRKALIELSKIAQMMRKNGDDRKVNDIIIEDFYTQDGHSQFQLFRDWKEQGYRIKKGSRAFTVWGKKRKGQAQDPENEEEKEYKFFPLAYLFSNKQVTKE